MATLASHYTGELHVAEADAHACLFCLTDADVNIDDSAELTCLCCIVTPGVLKLLILDVLMHMHRMLTCVLLGEMDAPMPLYITGACRSTKLAAEWP